MSNHVDFILFLISVTALSVAWGRVNRIGYSKVITSAVYAMMKYSKINADLIRNYLVLTIYIATGLVAAVTLLAVYQVNIIHFLALGPRYYPWILVAFIAQNSLTGLMMQLLLVARPAMDVFSDLASVPWVRYTLMMPGVMRVISPLCGAVVEEVFFRGAVFLILLRKYPHTGTYWSIFACTTLFVLQQVLQTDTLGQGLIFLIGSTSISVAGCIVILYTGSFLPALLCHTAYAFIYLRLGTSMPKSPPRDQRPKPSSALPSF